VSDADERFRAMLTATEIKHWYVDRHSDYDFWNYGYPKNATGYFLEAIKELILRVHITRKQMSGKPTRELGLVLFSEINRAPRK
jgi:hypothetical protein